MVIRPSTWKQDFNYIQEHDRDWQKHTLVVSHDYLAHTILNEAALRGFVGAVTVCHHVFRGGDKCILCGAANLSRSRDAAA